MSSSIHKAAAALLGKIKAPPGTVNTLAFVDSNGPVIRVLVDPGYWRRIETLPAHFRGYRVSVEKRQPTVACI